MKTKHLLQFLGTAMIGEGIFGICFPKKYTLLWKIGPKPLRDLMYKAGKNPEMMRLLFAAEAGLGFWLAARQLKKR